MSQSNDQRYLRSQQNKRQQSKSQAHRRLGILRCCGHDATTNVALPLRPSSPPFCPPIDGKTCDIALTVPLSSVEAAHELIGLAASRRLVAIAEWWFAMQLRLAKRTQSVRVGEGNCLSTRWNVLKSFRAFGTAPMSGYEIQQE